MTKPPNNRGAVFPPIGPIEERDDQGICFSIRGKAAKQSAVGLFECGK
jgi:hypothetical protein